MEPKGAVEAFTLHTISKVYELKFCLHFKRSTAVDNGFVFVYFPPCHIFSSTVFTANSVVRLYCKCVVSYVNIYACLFYVYWTVHHLYS